MRLRLAVIAMAVLVAGGVFVVAHRLARAEQVRVAALQTGPADATAPVGAGGSGGATSAAAGLPRAPAAATAPVPAAPNPTPAPGPSVVENRFIQLAPPPTLAPPGGVGNGGYGVAPPHPYYAAGQMHYPVPVGDDPETNELMSQDQQLEQEVQSLARQLADSDDDKQRAELKDKLSVALEKQFDAQQKLRELEISRIEARVQKLRDLVRKRTESRRKIIENRFEQLLNDAEGLGWNSAKGSGIQFVPHGVPSIGPPQPGFPAPPLPASPKRS